MSQKRKFRPTACKPCWELLYCPYGPLVESYPLIGEAIDVADIKKRYAATIRQFAEGHFKGEDEILRASAHLEYLWPPRWEWLALYDYTELRCNVFGHVCPVFFNAERFTETKAKRPLPQTRYVPRDVMLKVVRRDGQICQICHQNVPDDQLVFDHIIPHSKGGPTSVNNLRVLCADCNSRKRDSLDEVLEERQV